MILSQTATYALRATLCLSEAGGRRLRVDDIAAALDVPRNYLSKILHVLARQGILDSTRGPGGGFTLALPPGELTLAEIVRHFDALPEGRVCLLGRETCSDHDPCPAHAQWKGIATSVHDFLCRTTLETLSPSQASALSDS